jgi:predicted Zn-dependent protease
MATLEQIIEEARALSPAEKDKLRQALERELVQPAPTQSAKPGYPTNEQERAWVEAHRDEYLGQWVALDGDHLVAHGTDARSVYDEARSRGVSVPYLAHVTPKVEAYVGGW